MEIIFLHTKDIIFVGNHIFGWISHICCISYLWLDLIFAVLIFVVGYVDIVDIRFHAKNAHLRSCGVEVSSPQ